MNKEYDINTIKLFKQMETERYDLHHPFVGSEHLILAILKNNKDLSKILGISYTVFREELIRIVGIPKKNVEFNLYTPLLKRIINETFNMCSDIKKKITAKDFIISILEEGEGVGVRILLGMNIDLDNLYDSLCESKQKNSNNTIEFGNNLNKNVNMNEKTIGRDYEIKYIIETLLRKKKSNPLLIGDAGVGKTAIVEELARKINRKEVPDAIKNYRIVSIEMSELVSGTKYRGEFEEKLTKIIEEVLKQKNIILFIDEIHTMVSAGGAEGAISAGDIFKPYLARGNIKCIGATTTREYDKFFANDKALSRRFETVMIKEPNEDETINIINNIKSEYEKHHNVKITSKNIKDIVGFTNKYIPYLKNPDKSIDFLDSLCSNVILKNDTSFYVNQYLDNLSDISKEKEKLILNNNFDKAIKLHNEEIKIEEKIKKISTQKNTITDKDIMNVLSQKTKIPFSENKNRVLKNISNEIEGKLSNEVVQKLVGFINKKLMNFDKSLLLLQKGKDVVSKNVIIETLEKTFSDKLNVIKLNGNDYEADTSITKLVGTSAGYVGYSDDYIFSKIKYNPFSLIYFDNYENASFNIKSLFKQIKENNYVINGHAEKINFGASIIILNDNSIEVSKIGFVSLEESLKEEYDEVINYCKSIEILS